MICQETPNLSCSHPQRSLRPPSESFSQSSSTSACVLQLTNREIAGVNLYIGPPLSAMNRWPSSVKEPVNTLPFWRVIESIVEFLKIETYRFIASSAVLSYQRNVVIFYI